MILLARHGETADNAAGRVQGHLDVELSDRGREQARALADACVSEAIVALYTSPLRRAAETAAIVGERLGLEPVADARFAESARGAWEGRLLADIEREEPEAWAAWRAAGDGFRFPGGGESLREQLDRVVAALVDVTQAGRLPALVVCHGGTIRVALCHTQIRGLRTFHDWDVPNGALIRL